MCTTCCRPDRKRFLWLRNETLMQDRPALVQQFPHSLVPRGLEARLTALRILQKGFFRWIGSAIGRYSSNHRSSGWGMFFKLFYAFPAIFSSFGWKLRSPGHFPYIWKRLETQYLEGCLERGNLHLGFKLCMLKLLRMMVDWHPFWFLNLFYSTEANTSFLGIFDEFCRVAQQEQRELLENENNCVLFI